MSDGLGEVKDERGIRLSNIVVGATIGAILIVVTFTLLGWVYGAASTAYLLYEGYTLVNRHPEDTLSESVWRLAVRPIVPLLFGLAAGWALATGFFPNAYVGFGIGLLYGHFFFQREQ